MKNNKTAYHPSFGDYTISRSVRAKGIRISVHYSKGVSVTIPWFTDYNNAINFVEQKQEWINKALQRQKEKAAKHNLPLTEGTTIGLITGTIILSRPASGNRISIVKSSSGDYTIHIPAGVPDQRAIESIVTAIRDSARNYIPQRVTVLAQRHGFRPSGISLKNNRSNWGSCSSRLNINLNIHLMRLPAHLCDYVILHELAHLRHRNHGPEFHKLVDNLCGGKEKEYAKALKAFRPVI